MSPESVVRENLWNIMGVASSAIPWIQILSGLAKLAGIASGKTNIEAAGLIAVASMFLIKLISLVSDGVITPSDINTGTICLLIIASNLARLSQILLDIKLLLVK